MPNYIQFLVSVAIEGGGSPTLYDAYLPDGDDVNLAEAQERVVEEFGAMYGEDAVIEIVNTTEGVGEDELVSGDVLSFHFSCNYAPWWRESYEEDSDADEETDTPSNDTDTVISEGFSTASLETANASTVVSHVWAPEAPQAASVFEGYVSGDGSGME